MRLNRPIVGMAATPSGHGYWLVATDGGIFSYGDARFYGSTGAIRLNSPIVGMAASAIGRGYWLVARDGGIFSYGDARFYGSAAGNATSVAGIARVPDGSGYWLVDAYSGALGYGSAFATTGGDTGPGLVTADPVATPWVQFPHVTFGLYAVPASLQLPTAGTTNSAALRADNGNGYNVWARVYPAKPTTAQLTAMLSAVKAALARDGWTITDDYSSDGNAYYAIAGTDKGRSYEGSLYVPTHVDGWQTAWKLTLYPAGSWPWAQWPRPAALAKASAWNLELVSQLNKIRAARRLSALTWCPAIAMSEQAEAQDQITRGYPETLMGFPIAYDFQELAGDFGSRASLFGYGGVSSGLVFFSNTNVSDVVSDTVRSSGAPSSGSFLFAPYAKVVGVGVATGAGGGRVWRVTLGDTTAGC